MQPFLIIHHTHQTCTVTICKPKATLLRLHKDKTENWIPSEKLLTCSNSDTSKLLVPMIDELLMHNNLTLSALSCIVINQGPGLFSTLRSVISTAHGLHAATAIPIVGIDALQATLSEFQHPTYRTIALLNAFNADVYYAISQNSATPITGYKKIDSFLSDMQQNYPKQQIYFVGNGTALYKQQIYDALGTDAIIPDQIPELCSIDYLGTLGALAFTTQKTITDYPMPLYLKKHAVELKH